MPKHKKGRQGSNDPLGAQVAHIVAVPRSVQTVSRQFLRCPDSLVYSASQLIWGLSGSYPVIGVSSFLTNASNWTPLTQMYDEFRPLRVRMKYTPCNKYTTANSPMCVFWDNDGSAGTGVSYAPACQYRTSRVMSTAEEWELEWDCVESAKELWYDISGAAAWSPQIGVALPIGSTIVSGTVTGWVIVEVETQVRGIK